VTALRLFLISLLRTKRVFWTLAVDGLLLFGLSGAGTPTTYGQSLSLVWSDEFNSVTSSNVDTTKWNFDTGNGGSNPGWGNNELEFYTSRTNNAYVAGGLLHIHAQIENTNGFRYTSARMKTQGLFWTTYGRIEWRAKLPAGTGMWPALWMMGTNIANLGWPGCGEIDVVENDGAYPYFVQGSIHSGTDASNYYLLTPMARPPISIFTIWIGRPTRSRGRSMARLTKPKPVGEAPRRTLIRTPSTSRFTC
jgi:beta-glucanase (GH16 family)